MLKSEYRGYYDFIIIICPTFLNNKTYQEELFIHHDRDVVPIVPSMDQIDGWLKLVRKIYSKSKTLIIVDDCASSQAVKSKTDALTELGFSGRHEDLDVWVLTQQYTSISRAFRSNIGLLVLFYTPNTEDMKNIIKNCGMEITNEEVVEYIKKLKSKQYSKLIFHLEYPYKIFYLV